MYAAIQIPRFRLQSALRHALGLGQAFEQSLEQGAAMGLIDPSHAQGLILEVSAGAAAAGVHPGMSPAQAMARAPALHLLRAHREAEIHTQQTLLQVASALSPWIEDTSPGVCTVDLRQFRGSTQEALHGVLNVLREMRLQARAGIAPLPDLASLAAGKADPLLLVDDAGAFSQGLPLSDITTDRRLLQTLADWGLHTAGQLLALPRQKALERLGAEGQALWQRARGGGERPLRVIRIPEEYVEQQDFEQEIETLEPLLFVLQRLLESLVARLQCTARVASEMELSLLLENRESYHRRFQIPSPTADQTVLQRILHTHLEQLRLEHRPVQLRLMMFPCPEKATAQDLFRPALKNPNRFGETIARLSAFLGEENVGVAELPPHRSPGVVSLRDAVSAFTKPRTAPEKKPSEGEPPTGLPLRRLRPAHPAQVQFRAGKPAFIRSARLAGAIRDCLGPFRQSNSWWEEPEREWEEWDIAVTKHAGGGTKTVLARIRRNAGGAWELDGFYNSPRPEG